MSIDEADPDILTQPKFNITRLRLLESEAKISAFLQKNITHRDLVTQVHRYANYAKEMLARDGVYVVDYPGIPQWVGTSSDTFGYSIRVYTDIKNIITYLTEGHIQHWCEYRIDPAYSSDPASLKYMPISV
ncbi:hypothetical protein FOL47_006923 [Perkinsus chesapeaki]|uniref:Uncharacterized protein n=1 Tax=Perkinsus chesapeaki TaxID=330153 RepID=A0A7J6LNS2_PERCH|nr:hypothetical protein FOL47_006923 [Perkinsus chesapeaki]